MSSSAGARVGPEIGAGHRVATVPDSGASGAPLDDAPTLTDQPARGEVWRARAAAAALLALVFGSGFAGLVYQMIFIRLSVLVFGATVDAVSTVVSAFVAGLAAGSVWGGRL